MAWRVNYHAPVLAAAGTRVATVVARALMQYDLPLAPKAQRIAGLTDVVSGEESKLCGNAR